MDYSKITENIGLLLSVILIQVTPKIIEYFKKQRRNDNFSYTLDLKKEIQHEIDELRATIGANRISILEYHNGVQSLSGMPFDYVSMTYESTDNITKDIIMDFQRIPISTVVPIIQKLDKEDIFIRTTDNDSDEKIAVINKSFGQKTNYVFKLNNSLKHGVLKIVWSKEYVDLSNEQLFHIRTGIFKINLLMDKLKLTYNKG